MTWDTPRTLADGTQNNWRNTMSNNIRNIKKSISNTLTAVTSVVAVSTEVIADTSGLIAGSIGAAPGVVKAVLATPFSATQGYLMESQGVSEELAHKAAYHILEQDMSVTVEQAGVGVGKLIAMLLEDDEDDANNADKIKLVDEDHRVA